MSLLDLYLDDALRAELSGRVTPGGVRLEDVIRSGLRHPDSAIGVYASDVQSYAVFRELFEPILRNFQAPALGHRKDLACVKPAAVVSTRIRVARNLAGHAFTPAMSRAERLDVEAKILGACASLESDFPGWTTRLGDITRPRLDAMILDRRAFGPDDKYMTGANIHADWPVGRSVFNTRQGQLSVWINEEDHLRVAVVMPGACLSDCAAAMEVVMSVLAVQLDFCVDAEFGHLTSCPSNVGSGMRASYMVDLRADPWQEPQVERLEACGVLQVRGASGEHSGRNDGMADIGFRNRVGIAEARMLEDMEMLVAAR